mgnify:CR=1 FL=1
MLLLDELGFRIVAHVHDEIAIEISDKYIFYVEKINTLMCEPIDWAEGLPLSAETFETIFYRK